MNYILFDDKDRNHLLPLTFTRPNADIRCGILSFREKWNNFLKQEQNAELSVFTSKYLRKKFATIINKENCFINSLVVPNKFIIEKITELKFNQVLVGSENDEIIAFKVSSDFAENLLLNDFIELDNLKQLEHVELKLSFIKVRRMWDIFALNAELLNLDFVEITKNRDSQELSATNRIINRENIFVEQGAIVEYATINAKNSKVYIGKNSELMENTSIRGNFAILENSELKMGAKIYGATTIGPHCKIGGEVNNSVFFGFSNKAHDGFLGNSVIGEWCNLGADTNNSNLKNTYEIVKLWSYPDNQFVSTGLQFCGMIMGDHSKSAINTMFNTGTVVGVSANIFGHGFPRNNIPSFSWGGYSQMIKYNVKKALQTAQAVCERRGVKLSEIDIEIFNTIYEMTE